MKWFKGLSRSMKAIIAFFGPTVTEVLSEIGVAVQTHHPIAWAVLGAGGLINLWGAALVWAVPNAPGVPEELRQTP